jgi:hypothetical protein
MHTSHAVDGRSMCDGRGQRSDDSDEGGNGGEGEGESTEGGDRIVTNDQCDAVSSSLPVLMAQGRLSSGDSMSG